MNNIHCPNCSATLETIGIVKYCDYCDYCNFEESQPISELKNYITFRGSIKINKNLIHASKFIQIEKWDEDGIILKMTQSYSPRVKLTVYPDFKISIRYTYISPEQEFISFIIESTQQNIIKPFLAIKTDFKNIMKRENITEKNIPYIFKLTVHEFLLICTSRNGTLQVITNLIKRDYPQPNFDEFIHYCRRFYNQCINSTSFIYAIDKVLICDNGN